MRSTANSETGEPALAYPPTAHLQSPHSLAAHTNRHAYSVLVQTPDIALSLMAENDEISNSSSNNTLPAPNIFVHFKTLFRQKMQSFTIPCRLSHTFKGLLGSHNKHLVFNFATYLTPFHTTFNSQTNHIFTIFRKFKNCFNFQTHFIYNRVSRNNNSCSCFINLEVLIHNFERRVQPKNCFNFY